MITHPRQTIHDGPGFTVGLTNREIQPGVMMPFVHLDVHDWSPSTLKRLLQMWPIVRATLPPIVFCHAHEDDSKHQRFVARFGWQFISDTPCSDGKRRRIYVHYR